MVGFDIDNNTTRIMTSYNAVAILTLNLELFLGDDSD